VEAFMSKTSEVMKALGFALLGATVYAQVPKPAATPEPGVTREVLFEQKAFKVTRTTRAAGSVEAPGAHAMEVLIIPTSEGAAEVTVQGKDQGPWKVGQAFYIPRDADHHFANVGKTPLHYIAITIP
jgi:mannose-6-phosphate isomerase-like protein (cupin superfamily)